MNLTIGIISCNRLKYLKSLIESLKCLKPENSKHNIEIIAVDNGSKEDGLKEYLELEKTNGFIDKLFLREERDWCNDEYHAKNIIIEESSHDILFFLQDDISFIGTLDFLKQAYECFINCEALCLDVCGVRTTTIFRKIDYSKQYVYNNFKYWGTKNNHFQTIGLFKKKVFDKCGKYPVGKKFSAWKWKDNDSIQQEDYYSYLVNMEFNKTKIITILAHVPLIITIWNDPRGGYAFVRENKRYGHYIDPPDHSNLYYKHLTIEEINKLMDYRFPSGFTAIAQPIGWTYAKDTKGEQDKYDRKAIIKEGPIQTI